MTTLDPYIPIDEAEALHPSVGDRATIYRKMKDGGYFGKPAEQKSANGKFETLIRVGTLPAAAQAAYWDRALRRPETAALSIDWTAISEKHAAKAVRRFGIVQRATAIQEGPRGERTARLHALAVEAGVKVSRIYEWLAAFRKEGVPGLFMKYGQRKGRYRKLTVVVQDFIKQQYLSDRQVSPMTVYQRVELFCHALRLPAPAYVTVLKYIKEEIPQSVADYHRRGPRYFEKEHEYKCKRTVSDLAVNEWITGDHRVADVWVYATDAKDASLIRPWYTCYGDIRSRLIDGVVVEGPSSDSIKLALRRWILQHGVPGHHYVDNGKDYKCHALSGEVVEFDKAGMPASVKERLFLPGVLGKMAIRDHHALPKKPWGKPIESWFKHVFTEWEKSLPGWCGNDPKNKPESLERDIKTGSLLTLEEFRRRAAEQMERWNQQAHKVLDGASPASLWQGVPAEIPHPRTLNLLLLKEERVKVRKNVIRAFGHTYYHEKLWGVTGSYVSYFYDPANIGELIVMGKDGHLCNAVNDELMRYGASEEAYKRLQDKKRAQRRMVKAYPEHQRVLYREQEVLAEASAQIRKNKVRQIHPDPGPRPGVSVVGRIMPGLDRAAAAAERESQAVRAVRTAPAPSRSAVAVKPEPDFMRELLED